MWPIGSKPGGIGDEHVYGPHLMQTIRQAFRNVVEGPSTGQGVKLIGEASKCISLDADMHSCVEGNCTWPVRVAVLAETCRWQELRGPSQSDSSATDRVMDDDIRTGTKRPLDDSGATELSEVVRTETSIAEVQDRE